MYEKHTDGRLIAELSNSELFRVMSTICNQIESARKVIEMGRQPTDSMLGVLNPEFSLANRREKAEGALRLLDQSLKNYLAESVLREIECSEFLQKAYGRNSTIGGHQSFVVGMATTEIE